MSNVPPFRSFSKILNSDQISILKESSHNIFTAKKKAHGGQYSSGDTFFIGVNDQPRSIVEQYALSVFHWFSKDKYYDPYNSGAEFWPLVIDGISDEVGAHYDKDYAAEVNGEDIYPLVGTVTYLSDYGAPTTFFQMLESTSKYSTNCKITKAWISRVESGKIVAFDGRYLHCAPNSLANIWGMPKPNLGPRVTLLVNVWFHTPTDALRCPFIDSSFESNTLIKFPLQLSKSDKIPPIESNDGTNIIIDMGDNKSCINTTIDTYSIINTKSTCVELHWNEGKYIKDVVLEYLLYNNITREIPSYISCLLNLQHLFVLYISVQFQKCWGKDGEQDGCPSAINENYPNYVDEDDDNE